MGIKYSIKKKVMLASIKKINREHPFDLDKYEKFQLAENASRFDINSYYFSAHNLEGESLLLKKVYRGDGHHDMWFVYHSKNGTYVNRQTSFEGENCGLDICLVEVGKFWKFSYQGKLVKMRIDETKLASYTNEEVEVEVEGLFTANSGMFDFTYHLDPDLLASALASEKWDKRFKNNVKVKQLTELEQLGMIEARLKLGDDIVNFKAHAMRNHTFGRRDFNDVNRHISLMALIRQGEALNLSRVSYPHMNKLVTGYYEKDARIHQISKSTNTARIPNLGYVPDKFAYRVELQNGITFDAKVETEVVIPFVFNDGQYIVFEGIGTFELNKRKARGIVEFGFNDDESRWNKTE